MSHGNGPGSGFDSPVSHTHERQRVTNEVWPYADENGRHARGIDDRPADEQLEVTVRVVFERDGETFIPGRAIRWTDNFTHACIAVNDVRISTGFVWIRTHDARPV